MLKHTIEELLQLTGSFRESDNLGENKGLIYSLTFKRVSNYVLVFRAIYSTSPNDPASEINGEINMTLDRVDPRVTTDIEGNPAEAGFLSLLLVVWRKYHIRIISETFADPMKLGLDNTSRYWVLPMEVKPAVGI